MAKLGSDIDFMPYPNPAQCLGNVGETKYLQILIVVMSQNI